MLKSQKSSLTRKNKSVISKLTNEGLLDNAVLISINNITLEDLIAIKLELSTRVLEGKYFGIPLWRSIKDMSHEAVLKTAVSICRSKTEAAAFLGMDYTDFRKLVKKYRVESFFHEERNESFEKE